MGDMRRLSNIKWIATGVDGHTHHTCGEWMYTCDAPPVEADEYERMRARAEAAEARVKKLEAQIAGMLPAAQSLVTSVEFIPIPASNIAENRMFDGLEQLLNSDVPEDYFRV